MKLTKNIVEVLKKDIMEEEALFLEEEEEEELEHA
jgi:hypothetical protein